MLVTVLNNPFVHSPESADEIEVGLVHSAELREALTRTWPTDAHCTQYAPYECPIDGECGTMPVRLTKLAVQEGVPVRMVCLIGDVDGPNHKAPPEWRAETERRLDASCYAWYATRNGYRVLMTLPEPFEINNAADEASWTKLYKGWCEHVNSVHQLQLDRKCSNWDRIFRLPNVVRESQSVQSDVRRGDAIPVFDFNIQYVEPKSECVPDAGFPKGVQAPVESDRRPLRELGIRKARRIAERCEPSLEGMGGDDAHFKAACEIATVLGEDADAIAAVLLSHFNPRCDPPWPEARVKREAERAAQRQATPEARYARRHETHDDYEQPPDSENQQYASFTLVDRSSPVPELDYIIEAIDFAPGKVSVVQAFANVAKTPFALAMAVSVASGLPFVGFPVHQCPSMFIAFEGGLLTELREARLCAGMGLVRSEVQLHYARPNDALSIAFLDDLERFVMTSGVRFIVIDTYGSALPGDIDHNSSEFAHWLRELGKLSDATHATVVVLMHENKSDKADGLRGISGHNAAPGAIQAAIRLTRKSNDRNVIDVQCTREVRKAFEPFAVRFFDREDGALCIERVAHASPDVDATPAIHQRTIDQQHKVREAGQRIMKRMLGIEGHYAMRDLVNACGEGKRPGERALALLVDAGLAKITAGQYTLTDAGRDATTLQIARALGGIGAFDQHA